MATKVHFRAGDGTGKRTRVQFWPFKWQKISIFPAVGVRKRAKKLMQFFSSQKIIGPAETMFEFLLYVEITLKSFK